MRGGQNSPTAGMTAGTVFGWGAARPTRSGLGQREQEHTHGDGRAVVLAIRLERNGYGSGWPSICKRRLPLPAFPSNGLFATWTIGWTSPRA